MSSTISQKIYNVVTSPVKLLNLISPSKDEENKPEECNSDIDVPKETEQESEENLTPKNTIPENSTPIKKRKLDFSKIPYSPEEENENIVFEAVESPNEEDLPLYVQRLKLWEKLCKIKEQQPVVINIRKNKISINILNLELYGLSLSGLYANLCYLFDNKWSLVPNGHQSLRLELKDLNK